MKRFITAALLILPLFSSYAQEPSDNKKEVAEPAAPKVIFFDVNETLLDLTAMRSSVGEALGDAMSYYLCGFQLCFITH